ncbi:SDR family oxidoreductase [Aeromonas simiae]|uniref:SDR family oxidoreductase n=1 Tax=Aeromonas simiae TaxID=218936 RepID=UPI0005A737DC|nr:SDR family oxidoreductase [Aeromonas simiae]
MYETILVTGATSGIGHALVHDLCGRGYRVYASGRNEAALAALMTATGCLGSTADLTDPQQALDLYQRSRTALGHIDVLVNNAGANHRKAPIAETSLEEFELQYALNLRAPYLLGREALREMIPRGSGYLINVVSTCALRHPSPMGIYSTMKSGLASLSQVMMKEAQPHGIKVSTLYPGGVDTPFRAEAKPHYMQPASVATTLVTLLTLPADVVVHEMTFRPPSELE